MKKTGAILIVAAVLVLFLLGGDGQASPGGDASNPYIGKLPSNFNYWYNLIRGSLVSSAYAEGWDGVTLNDTALIAAIAWQESGFIDAYVYGGILGAAGEIGLCQILPKTANALGWTTASLYQPENNCVCAYTLVQEIRGRVGDDINRILGGYNAGIAGENNPSIVQNYVTSVRNRLEAIEIYLGLTVVINP